MKKLIYRLLDIYKALDTHNYKGMCSMFANEGKYRKYMAKTLSTSSDLLEEFLQLIEDADAESEYADAIEGVRLLACIDTYTQDLY